LLVNATFQLNVNGRATVVTTDPERPLLEVLREDIHLTGTKFGCGEGQCRACTVLLDGRPVTSCRTPVSKAAGKVIVTIEGLEQDGRLHPLQQAFLDEGAMQCGYCVPGMILTAASLLEHNPKPSREQIVEWMNGNLCRCCGYVKIIAAIERVAETRIRSTERRGA
jgi:aerobic-type carbon monoxide dehydrogenase small subunit (CoxS/CutS family)